MLSESSPLDIRSRVRRLVQCAVCSMVCVMMSPEGRAQQGSFEVGRTSLPPQIRLESAALQCRPKSIVLYATADLNQLKVTNEMIIVAKECGTASAARTGLLRAIADPSGVVAEYADHFAQCASQTAAEHVKPIGLYTERENGAWGPCRGF